MQSLIFSSSSPQLAAANTTTKIKTLIPKISTASPPSSVRSKSLRSRAIFTNNQLSVDRMASSAAPTAPKWAQKTVTLPVHRRGCHLVTSKILKEIAQDLSGFKCGLAHFFLQHTSASLTVNENYDTDVRDDTETFLSKVVPEGRSAPWKHTLEEYVARWRKRYVISRN